MAILHVITGQTATGKTKAALELALKTNGILINCDARQIYQKLDIITGKDIQEKNFIEVEQKDQFSIGYYRLLYKEKNVPIWLYDIVKPDQAFSAYEYSDCALTVIKKILADNRTPIIVGGSYFYLAHLLYGVQTDTIQPNWQLRKSLEHKTVSELQNEVEKLNNSVFANLNESDRANPHRLMRKIEILQARPNIELTPHHYRFNLREQLNIPELNVSIQGMCFKSTEELETAIEQRVKERLEMGALTEIEQLQAEGYKETDPGLQTIGYQQLWKYLQGKMSMDEARTEWILREKQYAKRQLTFMKKDPNIRWLR